VSSYNADFNIPSFKVGWYFISQNNSFLSPECFLNNYGFHEKGTNPIFLVYDIERARSGAQSPFRAFKISDEWTSQIYRDENKQIIIEPKL